ncbi:RNA polymerase factor sigma-54 [Halobacillus litoralis]|uniref:RNA polymerase factor sigma-54 n=1 Tax=Halobacillus litoralis TaxID=45668 RepID=UPI0024913A8E|nr:RNA polymerase factor sigma-54 [Halobacillus litoralis]
MKLELANKQTTGLVMTTEMRQAITMLQFNATELWEHVRKEIEENPILSIEASPSYGSTFHQKEFAYHDPIDQIAQQRCDWREDLNEQAGWLQENESMKHIVIYLIGNLDENGFLTMVAEEITEELGMEVEMVEEARHLLINFDPYGVGCYNFQEYLLLQIEKKYPDSAFLYALVKDHLNLLGEQEMRPIAEKTGVSERQVGEALQLIKTLQPRPVIERATSASTPSLPDLILEKGASGFLLRDPYSITKQIRWDEQLLGMYQKSDDAYDYLDDCYKRARWLMQSIDQRRETIMRVAEVIIKHQKAFFEGGSLKPLTLKKVADTLDLHESTVSRAVSCKVIRTPDGNHELKSFFLTGYQSKHGEEVSSQQVKQLLQQLINGEEPTHPLSDQKLANELRLQHDLRVSRRTVAKYREALQIPSSSKRKVSVGAPLPS